MNIKKDLFIENMRVERDCDCCWIIQYTDCFKVPKKDSLKLQTVLRQFMIASINLGFKFR
jgi:hypothetical protein